MTVQLRPGLVLLFSVLAINSGCQWKSKRGKLVVVVAADRLSFSDVNCQREPQLGSVSGFDLLCQESVRFTHAFSPHLRSVPALTSLLTGLNPYEHKVRGNQSDFLAPQFHSLAEVFYGLGWRTAFFSGGPPVLRKSGLQQGFEVFDDNIGLHPNKMFRPFEISTKLYEDWLEEIGTRSSFVLFYVPDLNFIDRQTQSNLGEIRNQSFESQIEELDEKIGQLISILKKRKIWDQTTFVVAGLSGHPSFPVESQDPTNLRSENSQVLLMIKPPQVKPRDSYLSWTLDQNVSLRDLHPTLLDLTAGINPKHASNEDPTGGAISLASVIRSTQDQLASDRWIYTEGSSRWSQNSNWSITSALRKEQILFIKDQKLKVYNSIIDRQETSPLSLNDSSLQNDLNIVETIFNLAGSGVHFLDFRDRDLLNEITKYGLWINSERARERRQIVFDPRILPEDPIAEWRALESVQDENWKYLLKLGTTQKIKSWNAFAQFKMKNNKSNKREHLEFLDPCILIAIRPNDFEAKKNCDDLELIAWTEDLLTGLSSGDRRKAVSAYFEYLINLAALNHHRALGLDWDVSSSMVQRILRQEMILSSPPFLSARGQLLKEALRLRID